HSQVGVEDGERLTNLVMEFAADVLALLFLHMEELAGEVAQIAGQRSQLGVAALERFVDSAEPRCVASKGERVSMKKVSAASSMPVIFSAERARDRHDTSACRWMRAMSNTP